MKEIIDNSTGALLFKSEDERNPTEKRIKILENKVSELDDRVNTLTELLSNLIYNN